MRVTDDIMCARQHALAKLWVILVSQAESGLAMSRGTCIIQAVSGLLPALLA